MASRSALGLDVGRKRIGVAGCDGLGLMATGLTTIARTSFNRDIEQLRALVRDRDARVLVVGMPYSLDGSVGHQAKQVRSFAERAAAALELPLEYVDERLTSVEAEALLSDRRIVPSRNKAAVDRVAAALILQRWLDERQRERQAATESPS